VRKKKLLIYKPKKLIPGHEIESGLSGYYAAIPDRGFKDRPFKIYFIYPRTKNDELVFVEVEKEVKSWNRAERFRRFMDKWGRGAYTLGYFKMCDNL